MSEQQTRTTNDQVVAGQAGQPAPVQVEGEPKSSGRRKGRGAKSKQAERFREKKNQEFQNKLDKRIEDLKISLGYKPIDLFGERRVNPSVRPPLEVMIETVNAGEICDLTSEVLHTACKVPPAPGITPDEAIQYDAETLKFVTALQIESKIFHARSGTSYSPRLEDQPMVQRVDQLLPDAVVPLAVYIDQIGQCVVQDQTFVPQLGDHAFMFSRLSDQDNEARGDFACFRDQPDPAPPNSFPLEAVGPNGGVMHGVIAPGNVERAAMAAIIMQVRGDDVNDLANFVFNPAFLRNPNDFPWFGIVQMNEVMPPVVIPTFPQIVTRYTELRGRVDKKLKDTFIELHLSKGLGTEVQLVYSSEVRLDHGLRRVWSPRLVKDDALEMGAILQYGVDGPLSAEGCIAVETIIDVSAGLQALASVLTKRLK